MDRRRADRISEALAEFCGPISKAPSFDLSPRERDALVNTAPCVIALWSQFSWSGGEVLALAARAQDRSVLVSVTLDSTTPSGFLNFPVIDLSQWQDDVDDREFRRLIKK